MNLLDLYDHFMIDLDGVVYVGDKLTPGVKESLEAIKGRGKRAVFLTNDPRGSDSDYSEKLKSSGIPSRPEDIITSSMATAHYLKENHRLEGKRAFVVGSAALKEKIRQTGLLLVHGDDAKRAEFVVIGGHPEVGYEEIKIASLALRSGAFFVGTNRDPVYPTPEGLVPATGALIAAIEYASGKKAVIAGKPESIMFEAGKAALQSDSGIAIIGDSLDTDILGGKRAGIGTILVLTGWTKEEDLLKSEIVPDHVVSDLRDLLKEEL